MVGRAGDDARDAELEALRRRVRELEAELVRRPGLGRGEAGEGPEVEDPPQSFAERAMHVSERRFRAIFDQSFEYMGLLSPEGIVLEVNQAALDAAGVAREDVLGKPFWEARWWEISEEARERLREGIARAAAGEFVRFEAQQRGAGDEILWVDFSLKPVRGDDGRVVQLIPEGRDITALKRAQRAETSMLRALATLGESAAVLAHEIKNPITAVNAALRAVAEKLGDEERTTLEDLALRMERLERIMHRTLSFTRPVQLRRREIDALEVANQVLRMLRPAIAESGVDVRIDADEPPGTLHIDRGLIEEVLTNLLCNALEALEDGSGERHVRLGVRPDDDAVVFEVEDDGPGIADSVQKSLFKPFITTKRKGSGLGLAFCKKVVEEHGGTIEVSSGSRRPSPRGLPGARFTVRVPRRA
jgi:PAS domain S-box-containing protein